MSLKLLIRSATVEDAPAISALVTACACEHIASSLSDGGLGHLLSEMTTENQAKRIRNGFTWCGGGSFDSRRSRQLRRSALASNQTRIGNNMRIILLILLVTVAACEAAFAQSNSINQLRQKFDYYPKLPLDVKE